MIDISSQLKKRTATKSVRPSSGVRSPETFEPPMLMFSRAGESLSEERSPLTPSTEISSNSGWLPNMSLRVPEVTGPRLSNRTSFRSFCMPAHIGVARPDTSKSTFGKARKVRLVRSVRGVMSPPISRFNVFRCLSLTIRPRGARPSTGDGATLELAMSRKTRSVRLRSEPISPEIADELMSRCVRAIKWLTSDTSPSRPRKSSS